LGKDTLKYGSSDAGNTVLDDSEKARKIAQKIGKKQTNMN